MMQELAGKFRSDLNSIDGKAVFALIYTAAALTCIFYLKDPAKFAAITSGTMLADFGAFVANSPDNNLPGLIWWVGINVLLYVVPPVYVIKFRWRENVENYGLKFNVEAGFWKILLISVTIMLPIVFLMSLTSGFSAKYPFLQIYDGSTYLGRPFLIWEMVYFAQFFGLEFFFRGFVLHSLKRSLGLYSIFVMTVPYCMIHFGKPPAETFAAIIAGVFLGWLSYRNGNIWLGLILHCTVAFSMDVLALFNKGLLF
jgi:membrane protease YdiL (CAAX protease family)